jgi:hypothetical protein
MAQGNNSRSEDRRFKGKGTTTEADITAATNTVYTPATGKKVRLKWVGAFTSQNNPGENIVTVRLGTQIVYKFPLGNPGIFAHWESVDAPNANDTLNVLLSSTSNPVQFNYTVEEF